MPPETADLQRAVDTASLSPRYLTGNKQFELPFFSRCNPVQGSPIDSTNAACGEDVKVILDGLSKVWRREWDSNPRLSFPNTRFPSVLLKPLGHLSVPLGVQLD